jgi:5-methylcytosine-specific restriction endonuclease McrA
MAGDWIKMRVDLCDDPAVISIADRLEVTEDEIVGKLHRLWSWADKHTTDGFAEAITTRWVDKYVGRSGFAEAMRQTGWLEFDDKGLTFPNFDVHNGKSAKSRCEATIRQRLSRKNRDDGVTGEERTLIPRPFRSAVLARDAFTCVYCGTKSTPEIEATKRRVLSIDHIIPATRGGRSATDNLVTCCKLCNAEKNDRTPEEWGMELVYLQDGITYESQKICDKRVTISLPEKRREDKNKEESEVEFPPNLQTITFRKAWDGYIAYRKTARMKPLQPASIAAQLKKLSEWGHDIAIAAINETIANAWQGIFFPKTTPAGTIVRTPFVKPRAASCL